MAAVNRKRKKPAKQPTDSTDLYKLLKKAHQQDNEKGKHLHSSPYPDFTQNKKKAVWAVLEKRPHSSPTMICELLEINKTYKNRSLIKTYKYRWRIGKQIYRQGLKSLSCHKVHLFHHALNSMDPEVAVKHTDWKMAIDSKNGMVYFVHKYGRIEWFPSTGRINVYVKKPALLARIKQLISDAFYRNGIVYDFDNFIVWMEEFKLKGFHLVKDTGERLPYVKIGMLKDSNGVIVKIGDKSHPTSIEIEVTYPDWAERNERQTKQIAEDFKSVVESAMEEVKLSRDERKEFLQFIRDLGKPQPLRDKAKRMYDC